MIRQKRTPTNIENLRLCGELTRYAAFIYAKLFPVCALLPCAIESDFYIVSSSNNPASLDDYLVVDACTGAWSEIVSGVNGKSTLSLFMYVRKISKQKAIKAMIKTVSTVLNMSLAKTRKHLLKKSLSDFPRWRDIPVNKKDIDIYQLSKLSEKEY